MAGIFFAILRLTASAKFVRIGSYYVSVAQLDRASAS